MQIVKSFLVEEEGAEIAEYALLVVILALGLLTAAPNVQTALANAFGRTSSKINTNANNSALA
jgi:Flp pilus assembly pilin Flp